MKIKILIVIFFYLNFLCIPTNAITNKIILKVENEIITNYEVKNKILTSLVLAGDEITQENINKLKKQALESLIQNKLKIIELKKYKIKKNKSQINSYLNLVSENNIEKLQNKFKTNNLDYDLFLKEVEIQTKWQNFIYLFYKEKIEINQNSVKEDLKEIIENDIKFQEFNISEIEIMLEGNTNIDQITLDLKNKIKDEGFETAALKYSMSSSANNKGNLGWISSKSLSKEIFEVLKTMDVGQISYPIKRQNSILFLKLVDERTARVDDANIEKLKERIIEQKKNEMFNLYSKSHLSKLKNTVLIEYK
ncbi:peptidylprolyl isomerase [Candidatus Pelagibacter bacterium]|nr:peptidylprolyl isomerase [Candidatus Pelagibacter bacterium]